MLALHESLSKEFLKGGYGGFKVGYFVSYLLFLTVRKWLRFILSIVSIVSKKYNANEEISRNTRESTVFRG